MDRHLKEGQKQLVPEYTTSPLTSICILAETPTWLSACLDAALAQVNPSREIIVIDCSASSTIEAICATRGGIRHLHAKNTEEAIFIAITNSRGRYIKLVRNCDLLTPDCIEQLVTAIAQEPGTQLAFSTSWSMNEEGKKLGVRQSVNIENAFQLFDGNALCRAMVLQCNNVIGALSAALFDGDWLRRMAKTAFLGNLTKQRYAGLIDEILLINAARGKPVAFVRTPLSASRTVNQAPSLEKLTDWKQLIDEVRQLGLLSRDDLTSAKNTYNNLALEFAAEYPALSSMAHASRYPDEENPHYQIYLDSKRLLSEGKPNDAFSLLRTLAEKKTSCWQVYELLSDFALARQEDKLARTYLETAISKRGSEGKTSIKLAALQVGAFQFDLARRTLTHYLAAFPDDHEAADFLGSIGNNARNDAALSADAYHWEAYAALDGDYAAWIARTTRNAPQSPPGKTAPPTFEFVILTLPDTAQALADTIDAIAGQHWPDWHLSILAPFPPPDPALLEIDCISWHTLPNSAAIPGALQQLAEHSTADWLILASAGTQHAPDYLDSLSRHSARHPEHALIYTDDDHIDTQGKRCMPRFKPDFDIDYFHAFDYLRDIAIRRTTLSHCCGETLETGAEIYDLTLRVAEQCGTPAIGHIDHVLAHRSVTLKSENDPNAIAKALTRHFARRQQTADICHGPSRSLRQIRHIHTATPRVSLILQAKNRWQACLSSLLTHTRYPNWDITLISRADETAALTASLADLPAQHTCRIQHFSWAGENNPSAMTNAATHEAEGDYLLLLDSDTEAIEEGWLDTLMSHAQRPEIGIVGARLLHPDHTRIQHAGIVLGMENQGFVFHDTPAEHPGYLFRAQTEQRYSAVSGACLLVRKSLYREVGGLDDVQFKTALSDIDLCLKVRQRGFATLWTPYATLLQHKASPPTAETLVEASSKLFGRWRKDMRQDPAWNINLSLATTEPSIESELITHLADRQTNDKLRFVGMPLGAAEYRTNGPFRALNEADMARCYTICPQQNQNSRTPSPIELARMAPQSLLIQAPADDQRLIALLHYQALNPDIFRIYSLDDLITQIPDDNPTGLSLPPDVLKERLRIGVAACQRAIVSTEPLADLLRAIIPDVRVVPNMLSRRRWDGLVSQRRNAPKIRVGWAGAQQHAGDLRFILDVVAATHKEVDWIFFGMMPEGAQAYLAEFHPYLHDFDAYPAKLASLDLDLAIAPLIVHPFNEAKSNLRLLEYGVFGWPVICTDIFPYRTDNAPVTRLPNDAAQWIAAIRQKVQERAALAAEGDALQQWVQKNYMLEDHLGRWQEALTPPAMGSDQRT